MMPHGIDNDLTITEVQHPYGIAHSCSIQHSLTIDLKGQYL